MIVNIMLLIASNRRVAVLLGVLLAAGALLGGCATSRLHSSGPPPLIATRSANTVSKLDNGMRVIVRPNHRAAVVALQLWIDTGSADESDALAGAAHALEHMVFKGTARRGVGDIARAIESVGGDVNAWTSVDHTVFHVTMPAREWRRGLAVLADAVLNVRLDEAELRKEIEVILEEIKESDDNPASVATQELFGLAFERHPYRRPVIGWAATVQRFRRAALERFLRQSYTPGRMALVVVGDVDAARVSARAARIFGTTPAANLRRVPRAPRVPEPPQRRLRVRTVQRPCREAQLALGFSIPELTAADSPALDLAAVILGQGEGAWLVRRVKDEQQVVTDIAAYAYAPREPGLLIVNAASRPERVVEAAAAIAEQLSLLAQVGPTRAELERARALVEGDAVHQQETVQGQARQLGYFESVAGDPDFDRGYLERVRQVDAAQVMVVARRYLRAERLSLVALTSHVDARLEADLRQAVVAALRAPVRSKEALVARAPVPTRWRLPGGARLVLLPDPSVPIVVMRAAWLGGLRYETAANNGINNLLAALATRGTLTRSADEVNGAVERMAGSIGGFSGRNSFGLRLDVLARFQYEALEVLADCVSNPAFHPAEVAGRRREALDEWEARADDPMTIALDLFAAKTYRRHPYRLNPLGTPRSISGLRRDALAAYYQRYFTVDRLVLVATGDLDVEGLRARCLRLFGRKPRRVAFRAPTPAAEPTARAPRLAELTLPKAQAQVVVGYPGTTLRSRDRHALELLAALLAGQGGRLFLDLRDGQGLAYRLDAFSQEGLEPGRFVLHVATSADKVQAVLEGIARHVARLREDEVSASELRRVQRYAIGTHQIALQRKSTLASCLAFDELYGLGFAAYRRYADEVAAVTPAQLRAVARRYLVEQRRVVAIVRPEGA
ncbi:MAG: insulinase family protein [Proteobacteria bacterium]|nr:insulinase family protein [Pseudomonadota bacterium]